MEVETTIRPPGKYNCFMAMGFINESNNSKKKTKELVPKKMRTKAEHDFSMLKKSTCYIATALA